MVFICCPVCGNTHFSDNLCKDCGFDCSTDAEHYQTLMIIEGWKSAHAYNKKAWTNSWDFWKNIKIARSSIQTITFQKGFEGCMEGADELIDSERNLFRVWCVDNHMYIGADRPIVFPEDISYLFSILKNLSSIEFDNINTSKVTDMRYLFAGCSKLTELDLSCFDTSHVTNMSDMFYGCGRLETLNIHSFDTTSVTDMSNMFYGCGRLTKLDLSAFDISNVTSLNNMFYGCCKLTGLDLFSYDSSNERNIEDMFYGCASLPQGKYFLPVLDQYSLRSIVSNANRKLFWGLTGIPIGAIKTITFRKNIAYAPMDAQDLSLKNDRSILAWMNDGNLFIASNGIIEFPSDASYMFSGMDNLVSIDFNCCVDTSKVTDMHNMFCNSSRLTKLDLSCFDTSNVTDMSWMFAFCNSLAAVDVSSFNTSKVINMSSMFYTCGSLRSLNLKNFRTPQATNMRSMFSCCYNLESLILTGFDSSCVSNMFAMFDRSRKLNTLLCSDSHILEEYERKH